MRWLTGSLRRRVAVTFAVGGLAVCTLFALTAYSITRGSLFDQRERAVLRRAYMDAGFIRDQLATAGSTPADVLDALAPQGSTVVLVHADGSWYSSALDVGSSAVPPALRQRSEPGPDGGQVAYMTVRVGGQPRLVVGVPLPAVNAVVYEVASLEELRLALRTLATVLTAGAVVTSALAALVGWQMARRVIRPLAPLASTAAAIAAGDLSRRLPATRDPDLTTIVQSFNRMVDGLEERLVRDARFAADVSHELRSPLTTLVTSVELLQARRHEMSSRSRQVLDLLDADLARFQSLLENLLELARRDAGAPMTTAPVELDGLVRAALRQSGRRVELLSVDGGGPFVVVGDKLRLERAVSNLLDNADRHGGGLTAVTVRRQGSTIAVLVDDGGSGVPKEQRDHVFERFATAGGPRGSSAGAGLGLALVQETALAHGGTVTYCERDRPGARFALLLPAAS